MTNNLIMNDRRPEEDFAEKVGSMAVRKQKANRRSAQGLWVGLGTMGLVGWSVAVPTLAGAAFGIWIDKRYSGAHSWTLAMLVAGLCIGCFTAWYWIAQEGESIKDEL